MFILLSSGVFAQEGVVSQDIKVGVQVPNFSIDILTNEGLTKSEINGYRGKVVILEFWATYCGPCLPAMDHLAKIRSKFTNDVEFFAITDEPRSKVVSFLNQRPTSLLIGIDTDRTLNRLFYHQFMPHTVIIGPDGFVKAITSPDQITEELIYLAKSGAELAVKTKAEFASNDINDTALVPVSVEDNSFYKVIVSPHVEGVQSQVNKKSSNEYEFINCTVPMMYQALYQTTLQNANERPCLEVTQQTKYLLQENYQYCLKLKVPAKMEDRLGEIGMRHLDEVFAIKPQNEMRTRNVYSLVFKETIKKDTVVASLDSLGNKIIVADSLQTSEDLQVAENSGGAISIKEFIALLWETRLVDKQIINDSGLPDETIVNVEIPTQVHEVGECLASIGLKLEPKTKEMSCLILHEGE